MINAKPKAAMLRDVENSQSLFGLVASVSTPFGKVVTRSWSGIALVLLDDVELP